MNTRRDGGGGGATELPFLSAHRCPGVDLLPNCVAATRIPSPCEGVQNFTLTASPDDKYLHSSCHSEEEEENISDWSEEDLSLHLSPSVILPSDEESDPGSDFECVDVIVDPQVRRASLWFSAIIWTFGIWMCGFYICKGKSTLRW